MPDRGALAAPRLVLAFDFGKRRIGVARGDTLTATASPLATLECRNGAVHWEGIGALVARWRPALIVVGLPYNVDGSESAASGAARKFAAELERRFATPIEYVDERYSSLDAHARLKESRRSRARPRRVSKGDVDGAAACVILERWFQRSG